jgi:dTDP-4-dehydrorhamnose reductase
MNPPARPFAPRPLKVLLFGARGYLGRHFQALYPDAACPAADIADPAAVAAALDAFRPQVVINAAGKTGRPNVDWCEEHRLETVRGNVAGPLVLLQECGRRGLYWVQLSSGCLYAGDNGGRGFAEDDPPNFTGSFYARTKLWSEQVLRDFPVLLLRLRMPFDGTLEGRNLIRKLRGYRRVLDVPNSLTHLPDGLAVAAALIRRRATGVYHLVNPGALSPYEVMGLYRELVDPSHAFERLSVDQLPEVARAGRSNCVLSVEKLRGEGICLPPVRDAVRRALAQMREAEARVRSGSASASARRPRMPQAM